MLAILRQQAWHAKLADLLTMCAPNAQASTKSHFCTSLLIQPPAGAWDVQLAAPRVCWGVPSGPEPATRPELRAAKVLWIVGVGPSPDTRGKFALCRRASCLSSPIVARWNQGSRMLAAHAPVRFFCADSALPACINSQYVMQRIGYCYGLWPVSGALSLAAALAAAALPSHVLCSGDSTAAA